ncbi:MAG: hypothetical protein ACXIUV_07900 [Alkalilacustris sp.]
MSLVRPEVTAGLRRWREVLAGLGVAAAGLWLAGLGGWFFAALGGVVVLAGLGLALAGLRRLRFVPAGNAPGLVRMVEGQVAYFGPETGGFAALTELEELRIAPGATGPVWVLDQPGGPLEIPVAAEGAERLYDYFAALPGIDMAAVAAAMGHPPARPRVLWRRHARAALPG